MLKDSYNNTGFLYIFLTVINWLHILLNLAAGILICLLLKITFQNVWQGTTTYQRHLKKMAKKDTSLNRELRENFIQNN